MLSQSHLLGTKGVILFMREIPVHLIAQAALASVLCAGLLGTPRSYVGENIELRVRSDARSAPPPYFWKLSTDIK